MMSVKAAAAFERYLNKTWDDRQWIRKCSLLWPGYLRRGGTVPPGADLYGLASHDWGLVGTDVGELDRPRRRGWPRFFRVRPKCESFRRHNQCPGTGWPICFARQDAARQSL